MSQQQQQQQNANNYNSNTSSLHKPTQSLTQKPSSQLREALSDQQIKDLRGLIDAERRTKALPQLKNINIQGGSKTQNEGNGMHKERRVKDKIRMQDQLIVRSFNKFDTYDTTQNISKVSSMQNLNSFIQNNSKNSHSMQRNSFQQEMGTGINTSSSVIFSNYHTIQQNYDQTAGQYLMINPQLTLSNNTKASSNKQLAHSQFNPIKSQEQKEMSNQLYQEGLIPTFKSPDKQKSRNIYDQGDDNEIQDQSDRSKNQIEVDQNDQKSTTPKQQTNSKARELEQYQREDLKTSPTQFRVDIVQLNSANSQQSNYENATNYQEFPENNINSKESMREQSEQKNDKSIDEGEEKDSNTKNDNDNVQQNGDDTDDHYEHDQNHMLHKSLYDQKFIDNNRVDQHNIAAQSARKQDQQRTKQAKSIKKQGNQNNAKKEDYNLLKSNRKSMGDLGQSEQFIVKMETQTPDDADQNPELQTLNTHESQEFEEIKQKLLEYKVDVNSLIQQDPSLNLKKASFKYQQPKKQGSEEKLKQSVIQDQINFSSLIMNQDEKLGSQQQGDKTNRVGSMPSKNQSSLMKSQSMQDLKLPSINIKTNMKQAKVELERQKFTVGKILNDKEYILSMEYLKSDVDYDKNISPQNKYKDKLRIQLENQEQPLQQNIYKGQYLTSKIIENDYNSGFKKIKVLRQNPATILMHQRNNHLNVMYSPNNLKMKLQKNGSPMQITKAYQEFLDSNRDQPSQLSQAQIQASIEQAKYSQVMTQQFLRDTSQTGGDQNNKNIYSTLQQKNLHLLRPINNDDFNKVVKEKNQQSQSEMNLFRQKLNSSNGRKHFIVAYNLSETLRENKLELECNDYKKIKELISDISKKRFETRHNNINGPQTLGNLKPPTDINKMALNLNFQR
eukprot:403367041